MACEKPSHHPMWWDRHMDVAYDKKTGEVDKDRTKLMRRMLGNFEEYETPRPMMGGKHGKKA